MPANKEFILMKIISVQIDYYTKITFFEEISHLKELIIYAGSNKRSLVPDFFFFLNFRTTM